MELNYLDELKIDIDALDVESAEAATKYERYTRLAADATREAKRAAEKVKTIRSEIILKVNKDPELFLGKNVKVSDPKVEAYFRCDREYQAAKEAQHDAEHEAEVLNGAAWAFKMRNEDIAFLLRLFEKSYFTGPLEPRNLSEELKRKIQEKKEETEVKSDESTRKRLLRRYTKKGE